MFLFYSTLLDHGYQAFSIDDQQNGVVARFNTTTHILEVVCLRSCTISSVGEGLLTVEVFAYRQSNYLPTDWPLSEAVMVAEHVAVDSSAKLHSEQPQETQRKKRIHKSFVRPASAALSASTACKISTAVTKQNSGCNSSSKVARAHTAIFLPTNETVTVHSIQPYLPIHAAPRRASELGDQQDKHYFLTVLDLKNRARGYNTYLPDSYAKFRTYWQLAFGMSLPKAPMPPPSSTVVAVGGVSVTSILESITTTGTAADSTVYLATISSERMPERVVPLQALAR